ncbi:MAG: tetratricopeptide repeat protein, partial [Bryobacterales bacterium]|nr:tetratricopeptide repeat protein [Bryobacterales bacterium]
PMDECETHLRAACAGDIGLFEEVWGYVQAERRMGGFLLDPFCPRLPLDGLFEPGEILHGRFRILREVAQGGMGIVYEARDEKLDRRIALKCAKAGFTKRLPPEVRNASEVSHPNVCKIFEIHTTSTPHGEVDFLTMEFLDGQTLSDLLQAGPLPASEAGAIARQLCAGLAEAHRRQVIHGDLKTSNVIVTRPAEGVVRAVITDFGLARKPESSQWTMPSGPLAGTPNYMAPELWKGVKPSAASDIYALGIILRELRPSGRPRHVWPHFLTLRNWDRTVARCLHAEPGRRFANADQIARSLFPITRRWVAVAAAAVILTVGSAVGTYRWATTPQESVRLALLPLAFSKDTAPFAGALSRQVAGQLDRLEGGARAKLTVIPLTEVLHRNITSAGQARDVLGATHVLRGTLARERDGLVMHAYLTDTRSQVDAREWRASYGPGDVPYLPVALAGMVTGTLRLPPLVQNARVSEAARHDYNTGLALLRRNSGVDAAIPLLERAVALDPDSPLTYAALAEGQWWKYKLLNDPTWLERTSESIRQAERRNPDLAEVHRVGGLVLADSGWYEQAAAKYLRAIELEPGSADAHRRLGMAYEANNQMELALAAYQRAVELDPTHHRNHQALGNFYNQRANYEEAAKHFLATTDLVPDEPSAHFVLGSVYNNLGRFAEAETELRRSLSLGETPTALNTLGVVLMNQRRDREAIPFIESALARWPEKYLWWINLGIAYRRTGLPAESLRANRRGLTPAEAEVRKNPRNGYVRACLAYLLARLGDRARAESEVAQALQLAPKDIDARWMAVATYEALGRRDDSLAVLRASPPGLLADISRFPDLADLSADSRFQQLWAQLR